MWREIRVFVSLIVWLFSVTGAVGYLIVRPSHLVLVKGSVATLRCSSNRSFPTWKRDDWSRDSTARVVDQDCKVRDRQPYIVRKCEEPSRFTCDLTFKPTASTQTSSDSHTARHTCGDFTETGGTDYSIAQAVLIFLESPLTCEAQGNELSCTLRHSAYMNTTVMLEYLKILLVLKDPTGGVVSSKPAGFMDNTTVLTAAVAGRGALPPAGPYACSANFEVYCDAASSETCVDDITIVTPEAVQCQFKDDGAEDDDGGGEKDFEGGEEKDFEGGVPKVRIPFRNQTSNANLERDGVDAIAMLMSLLAAFLVH